MDTKLTDKLVQELTEKNTELLLDGMSEIFDLADKYRLNVDIVYDIYVCGMRLYREASLKFAELIKKE